MMKHDGRKTEVGGYQSEEVLRGKLLPLCPEHEHNGLNITIGQIVLSENTAFEEIRDFASKKANLTVQTSCVVIRNMN